MSNWGISPNASEKEKIKADYADILHGMNGTGAITYGVYSDLFDDGMELLDRMYEQGKADAVPVVRCKDCKHYYRYTGISDQRVCGIFYEFYETTGYPTEPDDFCSCGERRGEE